eukprot:2110876-Pyramimonas_sp.AAC.1
MIRTDQNPRGASRYPIQQTPLGSGYTRITRASVRDAWPSTDATHSREGPCCCRGAPRRRRTAL